MLNVTSGVTTKLSLQGQKESADIATTATLLLPPLPRPRPPLPILQYKCICT